MGAAFADTAGQYAILFRANNEEFIAFTDLENYSAQLLAIHFLLVEFALGHFTLGSMGTRFAYRKKVMAAWMEKLAGILPEEYKKYAEWPMRYVREWAS